jgi:hypothetical protein
MGDKGHQMPVDVLSHYIYSANKCLLWLKVSRQEKDGTVRNAVINALLTPTSLAVVVARLLETNIGNVTISKHECATQTSCIVCMPHSALLRVNLE